MTDRQKLTRAFARIRKAGGITVTGLCCQTCSWAEAENRGATDKDTVAIHHQQGIEHAFARKPKRWHDPPAGTQVGDLCIYHQGDVQLICDALRAEGLNATWSGDRSQAIIVRKPEKENHA